MEEDQRKEKTGKEYEKNNYCKRMGSRIVKMDTDKFDFIWSNLFSKQCLMKG